MLANASRNVWPSALVIGLVSVKPNTMHSASAALTEINYISKNKFTQNQTL